ncbi:UvrD/REP helicase N-terminal domain-containing protein [Flavobacterium gillisiae]|uniref:DNA 3'-5' helicase II n=1 Tax=Flavobacterium gillisiae TaxID=150146 RepID=A0A1H4FC68_9FLAO|nr:UvrD-helicase domain-containing protein [Flavobacterium gillisiae]SEA94936.1 UvrD/REP helicase N-terminal domain-containing protein [Flavobacterium gillisiae]
MLQEISITDDDILYSEKILLPEGKTFDDERKDFIRNLNTLDLQAVPGSGKTTVLLAKLLILERKLPFADGSGILVLSHTNAAIDEIKYKIQKHCPKLFSYPNFIGTIQSFVDDFLAIPFYTSKFKKKPIRIDSEIFDEIAGSYYRNLPNSGAKNWLNQQHNPEDFFKNLRFDVNLNLIKGMNGEICLSRENNSQTYKTFTTIKTKILKSGFLHYDDAYFLAELYLKYFPDIKNILQKRFSNVYVDEMQDMDTHQYDLLEKLFFDQGNSLSIFQRIGDKNQAIYNSVKASEIWSDRLEILRLSGSQRLSKPISDIVCNFALHTTDEFEIVGLNDCEIKPHILVFDNSSIEDIIPHFTQLLRTFKEDGSLIDFDKYPTKVIAWNTEWKTQADLDNITKLRLVDYFNGFKKDNQKPKQDYNCLKSYLLFYDKNKLTLEPIRKNILNAFLKILRLENLNSEDGRTYTKKKLIDFIKQKDFTFYEQFSLNIYNWSIGIIKGKTNGVWDEIKEFAPTFSNIFSPTPLSTSLNFISADVEDILMENVEEPETTNIYKEADLEIEITSVHAVKGQTHCATLYLESFFDRGYGNYESERLRNQFIGTQTITQTLATIPNSHDKIIQSTKMAYVGFSRPTNFLCIAIHKVRFNNHLSGIDRDKWEIIEI